MSIIANSPTAGAVLLQAIAGQPPIGPRRFSVDEFYRMTETGILAVDEHVELIDGAVMMMSPMGSAHGACISRLVALLPEHFKQAA